MRPLFLIHRWAGLLVGLMTLVWFASGIVVHWYAYVDATELQRLLSYGAPLTAGEIRGIRLPTDAQAGAPIMRAALHHLLGELVWRTETSGGSSVLLDARSGERRSEVTPTEATRIAGTLLGLPARGAEVNLIAQPDAYYYEQSFQYEFTAAQPPFPVYRVGFTGPPATDVYIDPATGQVAAVVGPRQRITRRFGTLPHFLNPAPLHGHPTLHLLIMIGLLLGVLTSGISGLTYGVWFLWRRRRRGSAEGDRRRPLRRVLAEWHNWIGVVGGTFVITWAVSGCLMLWYPDVTPDQREVSRLDGSTLLAADFRLSPDSAVSIAARAGGSVVVLQARVFLSRPVYDARHIDGGSTLVDGVTGAVLSPLPDSLVRGVVRAYLGRAPVIRYVSYLRQYDAYYFALHGSYRPLPVYRVDLGGNDTAPSPLYVDALRGGLVGRVDGDYRVFRWYGSALHTMDFPGLLFHPTAWHLVLVGFALVGVALSGSGLWLGLVYLRTTGGRRGRVRA